MPTAVETLPRARQAASEPEEYSLHPSGLPGMGSYKNARRFQAAGGEADLWLVDEIATGATRVLKLYRFGVSQNPEVLEKVRNLNHAHAIRILEAGEWGKGSHTR